MCGAERFTGVHSQLASGLLEAAPDAIVGVSGAGLIVLVNAAAERLFGYPRDELLGQPLEVLVPEAARGIHPGHRADYAADPSPRIMGAGMDLAGRRRDGTEFQAEISLSAIGTGESLIISAAVRDVTERERAGRKFRGLLEAAPDAIVGVSADGVIVLVNAQTEQLFGYRRDELLGQRLEMLVPEAARAGHPQHRAEYAAAPSRRPMGAGMELAGRRKDGTEFPAEIMLSAIETGEGIIASAAVRDVTDRKHIEQQLREMNAELQQIARARDTFLASMSHELRTPLNAIIGFTGTLLMELPGPLNADQKRQLRTVEHSGKHLLAIINELLDLAKIDSGTVELTLEPVDCVELVDAVTSSLRLLATEKGLEFTVELPGQPVVVKSDQRALGQILINLVSNAIKFTEAGHVHVALDLGLDNGGPAISVADTGPGIRGDHVDRIFNAFERGEGGARGTEGTGLGLHISHQLATLIGAQVTVDTVYGAGSTFTIILESLR